MRKVKIFKFEVSNAASSAFTDDYGSAWYERCVNRLSGPEDIEKTINDFAETHNIVDIKVNNIDEHYHNNGRGNTIHMMYTVIWEE